MFSAVSNLGAGGSQDVALSDTANGVLYGMFALTGIISGGINNRASSSSQSYSRPSDGLTFYFPPEIEPVDIQFWDQGSLCLSVHSATVSTSAHSGVSKSKAHDGSLFSPEQFSGSQQRSYGPPKDAS